jgi:hypothetical protein
MSETVNIIAPSMNGGITETIDESMEIVATKEPWSEIEAIFNDLYEKWYEETKYLSSSQMFENEYYKKIISMGIAIVPVIIARLKETPEHLFVALNKITNINPVKSENRGKIKKMAEDWILWWEENKNVAE